jgi:hypothetical protein
LGAAPVPAAATSAMTTTTAAAGLTVMAVSA